MIGKVLGWLAQTRQAIRTPAAQVAIAGTLLTIGVRIVESVLTDVVEAQHTLKVTQQLFGEEHLHARLTNIEQTMMQLGIAEDGTLYHAGRRAAAEAEAAREQPADTGAPADVDGWPVGRSATVPVGNVRLEETTHAPYGPVREFTFDEAELAEPER